MVLAHQPDGGWSRNPIFLTLAGGGFGWQAGVQWTDVVLVFKTRDSLDRLLNGKDKITLGGNVGLAAGPLGRQAEADTDGAAEGGNLLLGKIEDCSPACWRGPACWSITTPTRRSTASRDGRAAAILALPGSDAARGVSSRARPHAVQPGRRRPRRRSSSPEPPPAVPLPPPLHEKVDDMRAADGFFYLRPSGAVGWEEASVGGRGEAAQR